MECPLSTQIGHIRPRTRRELDRYLELRFRRSRCILSWSQVWRHSLQPLALPCCLRPVLYSPRSHHQRSNQLARSLSRRALLWGQPFGSPSIVLSCSSTRLRVSTKLPWADRRGRCRWWSMLSAR